ncbi:3-keto-disaccharide hydrolase [Maribacter sp.]
MKRYVLVILLPFLMALCSAQTEAEPIFQENGTDYTVEGEATWRFENNELIGSLSEGAGFVMTKASYSDFMLELEFKPDSTINSGVFIRCQKRELSFEDCYEINIWDLHQKQEFRTGAVVSRFSPLKKIKTLNKWNRYRIKNEKDHLQAWINDILVVDLRDADLKNGPIALQAAEKGEIKFRNVKITKLE